MIESIGGGEAVTNTNSTTIFFFLFLLPPLMLWLPLLWLLLPSGSPVYSYHILHRNLGNGSHYYRGPKVHDSCIPDP